jgi:hypothetical protein
VASEVGICNRALSRLGASRISSLSDSTSKNARECNNAYETVRDAMLRRHPWNFAIKRASLAAEVTGPAFGPTNYFQLPSTCLRLLLPNDTGLDWIIEGRKIATSWSAPLNIRYIDQITDPNAMDVLFREALALQMAFTMCEAITQSTAKQQAIAIELKDVIAEAKRTNAIEKLAQYPPEDYWLTVRRLGFGVWPMNTRIS